MSSNISLIFGPSPLSSNGYWFTIQHKHIVHQTVLNIPKTEWIYCIQLHHTQAFFSTE